VHLFRFIILCFFSFSSDYVVLMLFAFITFRRRHSRGEMYSSHGRLCLSACLSVPNYSTDDPDVTWGMIGACRLVVHCWVDLQSLHGLCCYDNICVRKLVALYTVQMRIAPNGKSQCVLVFVLWLVVFDLVSSVLRQQIG